MFFSNYATNFVVGTRNGGDLIFGTNDTERVRILSSNGNFGINESNPTYKLDVNGTGRFSGNVLISKSNDATVEVNSTTNTSYSAFFHSESGVTKAYWTYVNSAFSDSTRRNYLEAFNSVGGFSVYTAGAKRLDIASTGAATYSSSVGIGVSPNTRLEVTSGVTYSSEVQRWSYNLGDGSYSLKLKQDVSGGLVKHIFDLVNNSTTYSNNLVLDRGNVGIGTSSPNKTLTVSASVAGSVTEIYNTRNNGSGDFVFVTSLGSNNNNTSNYHYIASTGGADKFYIYGNGTYTTVSDRRLKKNITKVTDKYLDKVLGLNIVNYNWNEQEEGQPLEFGLIAQEVEELIPSIVHDGREQQDGNIYKGIQASVLPYILIKAIQELSNELKELKAKIK